MKNYKKNIISIVILLCIVLILYFTPPIMLADGWIEFGSRADSFETHMLDEYNNFLLDEKQVIQILITFIL